MPAYDATLFDPPAPLARVTLRNPQNADSVSDVPMLLDSGADVTLIPSTTANELGLTADADTVYELMGFDGSTSLASVVQREMLFLNKTFRGRFLLIDQEWSVLGRDTLNLVSLLLNGPNLTLDEQRSSR
ncbi:MAG: aspartyl protease family protein [Ardenticatenaceae bacterium]|nr:aspartyl protease family protein [Ardenticatenaceae bacterium]